MKRAVLICIALLSLCAAGCRPRTPIDFESPVGLWDVSTRTTEAGESKQDALSPEADPLDPLNIVVQKLADGETVVVEYRRDGAALIRAGDFHADGAWTLTGDQFVQIFQVHPGPAATLSWAGRDHFVLKRPFGPDLVFDRQK